MNVQREIEVASNFRRIRRTAAMSFAGIVLTLLAGGYGYYRLDAEKIRQQTYQQLAAIGELKTGQMQQWRKERQLDGNRIAHSSLNRQAVADFIRQPDEAQLRKALQEELKTEQTVGEYAAVLLLTPGGELLLAAQDDSDPTDPVLRRAAAAALTNQTAIISDPYRAHDGGVYIDTVSTIREAGGQPLAMVVLRRNPATYLYPLLQSWPTPSRSAETLLVRREGDDVLFLNNLRFRTNTALVLREPLTHTNVPDVQAVLGRVGIFEGTDYRGVAVLADLRPIPESPWFMVAKVDAAEILAEARFRAGAISLVIGLIILLAGAAVGYFYRRRQAGLYRERAQLVGALQKINADLKRSNQELEQFAYVASHDLQEPLRMVASYTQLLGQRYAGQLDDKAQKYIHYAVDGATRMQTLINDLLAYSRVGSRGQPLTATDTHAVLGEALKNLAAMIAKSRAIVTNDDLPTVPADATQLVLVFQNLLSNAIKFQAETLPRIHVSAEDLGNEWLFAVKDNGIGIAPQHQERVFVIFQRLHTREEYPGTGIGLAVCRRVVERHGGKIWFESAPGQGTTFFFTLPKQSNTPTNQPPQSHHENH